MQKNSLANIYNYLYESLHNSKRDLFLVSLDSFIKEDDIYDHASESSVNYLGLLISDVRVEKTNNSSDSVSVKIPTLFGRKSKGSLTDWKPVFESIEMLVDPFMPVKGLILGEYVSEVERVNGRVEHLPEKSVKYLNVFTGIKVYDELIKRNIKDIEPLAEMQEYKLITLPNQFLEYLNQAK